MMAPAYKLLLLEKLEPLRAEGTDGADKVRFERLPFATVPVGEETPRSPLIVAEYERFPTDQLNLLRGIDWLLTESIDELNLSLGPPGKSFDPNHPLQIATHFAYELGIPVVVAAGNKGPGLATLQPLAQAPWVIAVGATDATGRLLRSSSRGDPSGAKPTVVADGTLPEDDPRFPEPGTSFAAPKVGQLVVWILKGLELLIGDLADQQQGEWSVKSRPIKMPIVGIADTGVDPAKKMPTWAPLAASIFATGRDHVQVSRTDREREWYDKLMHVLRGYDAPVEIAANPATVTRCLQLAAKPLQGYLAHEVGAGLVSADEVQHFFASITPSRFVDGLCPDIHKQIPDGTLRLLDEALGPLWDSNKCLALVNLFAGGIRVVHCKVV